MPQTASYLSNTLVSLSGALYILWIASFFGAWQLGVSPVRTEFTIHAYVARGSLGLSFIDVSVNDSLTVEYLRRYEVSRVVQAFGTFRFSKERRYALRPSVSYWYYHARIPIWAVVTIAVVTAIWFRKLKQFELRTFLAVILLVQIWLACLVWH